MWTETEILRELLEVVKVGETADVLGVEVDRRERDAFLLPAYHSGPVAMPMSAVRAARQIFDTQSEEA